MSLPYFPMFPKDFEAKTAHLSMMEDGAYNRLLRLCWMTPGCSIPADESWIMRRLRAHTEAEREAVRNVLAEFFTEAKHRYSNAKLSQVWNEAEAAHKKRVEAGKRGGKSKALKNNDNAPSNAGGNAQAGLKQPEPEPDILGGGGSAHARETDPPPRSEASTLREELLVAMGLDASGVTGPTGRIAGNMADMAEYRRWRDDLALDHAAIIAVIRETMAAKRDGPPSTFAYFTQPMRRAAAALAPKPMLTPIEGGRRHDDDNQPARASRDPHARALGGMVEAFSTIIAAQPGGRGRDGDSG